LRIVYRAIFTDLIKEAGFTHKTAKTGADTLIRRSGSALNLNVHFYMLFLDDMYVDCADGEGRQILIYKSSHKYRFDTAQLLEKKRCSRKNSSLSARVMLKSYNECSLVYKLAGCVGPDQPVAARI